MARPFLPLPSNLDFTKPGAVKAVNDALRRLAEQIPGSSSGSASSSSGGTDVLFDTEANRPAGMGRSDVGTLFLSSDTYRVWRWSGSAWVEVTPGNALQLQVGTGPIALSTSLADVPGASLTLERAGRYLITGLFDFSGGTDVSVIFRGGLNTTQDGDILTALANIYAATTGMRATVGSFWSYTAALNDVVKLRVDKTGGGGTASCLGTGSIISAFWIGP